MDEESERRARILWRYEDYAKSVKETVERRDDLHHEALALAKECDTRDGKAPDVPPSFVVVPGTRR